MSFIQARRKTPKRVSRLGHRRTVVGQNVWCIAKLCTLSLVMMSSVPHTCVCVCMRMCARMKRDCVSHTARSQDRTRAGIISPPRTKFLPSPVIPLSKPLFVSIHSPVEFYVLLLFWDFRTNHQLYFPIGPRFTTRERKESFRNLCRLSVYIYTRRFMSGSVSSSLYYLNVTIIPTDPTRYFE